MRISDWSSDVCSSDLGHELRTPLTILRGHLEVLDEGNPEEVAETRDMLLDEIDRMARLVNDLILLTKSNRPDFITAEPVDLDALTAAVVTKARGLGVRDWPVDGTTDGMFLERSEENTYELQSIMRIPFAAFCLQKKNKHT